MKFPDVKVWTYVRAFFSYIMKLADYSRLVKFGKHFIIMLHLKMVLMTSIQRARNGKPLITLTYTMVLKSDMQSKISESQFENIFLTTGSEGEDF